METLVAFDDGHVKSIRRGPYFTLGSGAPERKYEEVDDSGRGERDMQRP